MKINRLKVDSGFGLSGALVGYANGNSLKKAMIGAGIGLGSGELLNYLGNKHHKNNRKKAIKELQRRKLEKLYSVLMTEDELKILSDKLEGNC